MDKQTNTSGWARAMNIIGWQCKECLSDVHNNHNETSGSCSNIKWRNVGKGIRELIYCWCPLRKPGD